MIYQGRKGQYTIIRDTPKVLLVKYISGEWEGKEIQMSRSLHNRLQANIETERKIEATLEREALENALGLWYTKYPALYNSLWHEGITSKTLLEKLGEDYPEAASNVEEELSRW